MGNPKERFWNVCARIVLFACYIDMPISYIFVILSYKYLLERDTHISLLIDMGFSAVAIADRVGHESIEITYRYAHLFPSKQAEMADRLDDLGKGDF